MGWEVEDTGQQASKKAKRREGAASRQKGAQPNQQPTSHSSNLSRHSSNQSNSKSSQPNRLSSCTDSAPTLPSRCCCFPSLSISTLYSVYSNTHTECSTYCHWRPTSHVCTTIVASDVCYQSNNDAIALQHSSYSPVILPQCTPLLAAHARRRAEHSP